MLDTTRVANLSVCINISVRANVRVRTEPYFKVRTERSVRFVFGKNTCSDRTFGQNINFIKNEKWQFIRPITYQNFSFLALKLTEILGKNRPQSIIFGLNGTTKQEKASKRRANTNAKNLQIERQKDLN